jgi:PAS domain-containing protein
MRSTSMSQSSLEEELRASEERIARLSDALPVGVFQVGQDQRVLFTNGGLHRILGTPPASDLSRQFAAMVDLDWEMFELNWHRTELI